MTYWATSAYNNIYKAISAYPSERVAAAIAKRRQHGKFVSVSVIQQALEAEDLVVAVKAAMPTEADTASLRRVHNACTARKDTLDEKIARCMVRKGLSDEEYAAYEAEKKRHGINGWGYNPDCDDR